MNIIGIMILNAHQLKYVHQMSVDTKPKLCVVLAPLYIYTLYNTITGSVWFKQKTSCTEKYKYIYINIGKIQTNQPKSHTHGYGGV